VGRKHALFDLKRGVDWKTISRPSAACPCWPRQTWSATNVAGATVANALIAAATVRARIVATAAVAAIPDPGVAVPGSPSTAATAATAATSATTATAATTGTAATTAANIATVSTAAVGSTVPAVCGSGARGATVARPGSILTTNVDTVAIPPKVVHQRWPPCFDNYVVHDAHGLGREDEVRDVVVARGVEREFGLLVRSAVEALDLLASTFLHRVELQVLWCLGVVVRAN